jgi:D-glycerate 3-kinase
MSLAAQAFLKRHHLPSSYLETAKRWFEPLLQQFSDQYQPNNVPMILGINGSQGSGKSTLADYLCSIITERHAITAVSLSMDDFYLTRAEREHLAQTIHPLLRTRGVPGTHDVSLAIKTIQQLRAGLATEIPRFDKSIDDRVTGSQVDKVSGPVGLIVFEGWCLGALPQTQAELEDPINDLERLEDDKGIWRQYINRALATDYRELFTLIDQTIMLRAPSFDAIFQWRWQQEMKMIERLQDSDKSGVMTEEQVLRFIQYFQRITEHSLEEMPRRSQHLFQLEADRQISDYQQPKAQC